MYGSRAFICCLSCPEGWVKAQGRDGPGNWIFDFWVVFPGPGGRVVCYSWAN